MFPNFHQVCFYLFGAFFTGFSSIFYEWFSGLILYLVYSSLGWCEKDAGMVSYSLGSYQFLCKIHRVRFRIYMVYFSLGLLKYNVGYFCRTHFCLMPFFFFLLHCYSFSTTSPPPRSYHYFTIKRGGRITIKETGAERGNDEAAPDTITQ